MIVETSDQIGSGASMNMTYKTFENLFILLKN